MSLSKPLAPLPSCTYPPTTLTASYSPPLASPTPRLSSHPHNHESLPPITGRRLSMFEPRSYSRREMSTERTAQTRPTQPNATNQPTPRRVPTTKPIPPAKPRMIPAITQADRLVNILTRPYVVPRAIFLGGLGPRGKRLGDVPRRYRRHESVLVDLDQIPVQPLVVFEYCRPFPTLA